MTHPDLNNLEEYLYYYDVTLREVTDGDTLKVRIDVGFHFDYRARLRLLDVDAPETWGATGEEKARGEAATAFVREVLNDASRIIIRTVEADSFGRWLAYVYYKDEDHYVDLGRRMLELDHAKPYED